MRFSTLAIPCVLWLVGCGAGGVCNVEFCDQVDNYSAGFGEPGVDELVIECIEGPNGGTVYDSADGEYTVTGTYKLGTFDSAEISIAWGGTTSLSVNREDSISSGEGDFEARVVKESGGSGNLFLRMSSDSSWMFDSVPVNEGCD